MGRSNTYEGFETFYNSLLMSLKMLQKIIIWTLFLYIITGLIASYLYLSSYEKQALISYGKAQAIIAISIVPQKNRYVTWMNQDGSKVRVPPESLTTNKDVSAFIKKTLLTVKTVLLFSLAIFVFIPVFFLVFKKRAGSQFNKKYIRGAKFLMFDEFFSKVKEKRETGLIPLGFWRPTDLYGGEIQPPKNRKEIRMPVSCEPKHTAILGRPGVGKTVMFSGIVSALKQKAGYKGITYCYKGDYIGKFFDPDKDHLFNPLDKRTLQWNIFNEIETEMDIEMVAGSLFPTTGRPDTKDDFFLNGAKDVFIGLLYYLHQRGLTTNKAVWDHITLEPKDIINVLKSSPEGHAGLKAVGGGKGGQADGIFGVFMKHLKGFKYMAEMEGDFKIADWLSHGEGVVYICNYENLKETLKPVLTLFLDLMGRRLLSMPDSEERSIYFVLDELHTLQRLSSIVEMLTLTRSKGGKIFMGTQSFSQLDEIYGQQVRHSMINSCGNRVIMSLQDKEATIASEIINDIEYEKHSKTTSMGVSDFRDGISVATQTKKDRLVLPSQIAEIPELSAIVQLANYGLMNADQEYKSYPLNNEPFIMKDGLRLGRGEPEGSDTGDHDEPSSGMAIEPVVSTGSGEKEIDREFFEIPGPSVEDIDYDAIAQQQNQMEIDHEGVEF